MGKLGSLPHFDLMVWSCGGTAHRERERSERKAQRERQRARERKRLTAVPSHTMPLKGPRRSSTILQLHQQSVELKFIYLDLLPLCFVQNPSSNDKRRWKNGRDLLGFKGI